MCSTSDHRDDKLPHITSPCGQCPFRKDSHAGWLGRDRMARILAADSFVCHKRKDKQCAGFMLMKGEESTYVQMAGRMGIELGLKGHELVFESHAACVDHHCREV